MEKPSNTAWTIIFVIIALLLSTVYSLLVYVKSGTDEKGINVLSFGIITSILLSYIGLLYNSLTYLKELKGAMDDTSALTNIAGHAAKIIDVERLLRSSRDKLNDIEHQS